MTEQNSTWQKFVQSLLLMLLGYLGVQSLIREASVAFGYSQQGRLWVAGPFVGLVVVVVLFIAASVAIEKIGKYIKEKRSK